MDEFDTKNDNLQSLKKTKITKQDGFYTTSHNLLCQKCTDMMSEEWLQNVSVDDAGSELPTVN